MTERIVSFKLIRHQGNDNEPKAVVVTEQDDAKLRVKLLDINSGSAKDTFGLSKWQNYFLDVGNNGAMLAVAQRQKLIVLNLKTMKKSVKTMASSRVFTAVACHPQGESILTGDSTGRAVLWQNLFSKDYTEAVYHWHTLPVVALRFSTSGSMFYSGGGECVIVKWSVEDPNHRKYLPRLAAKIIHISASNDNSLITISTEDNGVQVVDARFTLVSTIQHLVLARSFPCGIKYDTRTKALVLNGITGHVQFYSPNDMHLLYNVSTTMYWR